MSRTGELQNLDKRHVWHPFTQMSEWLDGEPLLIERGQGNYLFDTNGKRYFDGVSSLWVTVHGHNHPHINRAITAQLEKIAHSTMLGLSNVPATELAAALVDVAPTGLTKVFYSDSGSSAVEIALKQAFQYWQHRDRPKKARFVHLVDSYHGDTLGAVGVGGMGVFHEIFGPLLVPGIPVPTPHPYRTGTPAEAKASALEALELVLHDQADSIAALIVEPLVQGAAGMLVHPAGYLAEVAALCKRHEVLLIADEVATGFGRTGRMFACEHENVTPDFMCLAKGLTGGYLPLAATLTTQEVFSAFLGAKADNKTFFHGHTYTGNALGAAAALASLELFETNAVLENMRPAIAHLRDGLSKRFDSHSHVGDIRQRGFMVGLELVSNKESATAFDPSKRIGARVCRAALDQGVFLRPLGDVIVLMPPLSTTTRELDLLLDAVEYGLGEVL
jgi:adenosylmethionine-8-amino-7-oxononanoate aminotransferase